MQEEPTNNEIAYIAGLLEGEGTFLRKGYCPIIQIGMTDLDVIEKIGKILNIKNRKIHVDISKLPNNKTKYIICLAGRDALKWMKLILPFMGIRRSNIINEIIKDILDNKPYYELGKDFCKRGHSIKHSWEHFSQSDGGRRCKRCVGIKVRAPLKSNNDLNYKFINPFIKRVI